MGIIAPLLPAQPPKPKGGRPQVPDRAALTGIIFVLKTGIPWEMLLQELGCGSGVTCWRRLRDWQEAVMWARLHRVLLDRLGAADKIDWSRAFVDSAFAPAKRGPKTGPDPTDRGKAGSKRHVVVDRAGLPLVVHLTAANCPDPRVFVTLIDSIGPIRRPRGRARRRPAKVHADKAYDVPACRHPLRQRGITGRIARKGVETSKRLGRHRWVVERTLSWLAKYRRLTIRYERRDDIHEAFLHLGCALICVARL